MNCYGLEYFCFEGDGLWIVHRRGADRAGQAGAGEDRPGAGATDVVDGCVVRQPKAYPVYDDDYAKHVATIRDELEAKYPDAAPGRPQRHAQVQQPGPRHDDGDAVRAEHPGGAEASTTCGRSTRTPSTTRRARPATNGRPGRRGCAWFRAASSARNWPRRRREAPGGASPPTEFRVLSKRPVSLQRGIAMSISGSCWNLATKVALRLGPRNPLVYAMLARRCQAHGAKFGVREGVVEVVKGNRVVRLAADHFAFAPDIAKSFDSYHGAVVPERQNDCLVIDYSRPRPQRYVRSGLVFEMCGGAGGRGRHRGLLPLVSPRARRDRVRRGSQLRRLGLSFLPMRRADGTSLCVRAGPIDPRPLAQEPGRPWPRQRRAVAHGPGRDQRDRRLSGRRHARLHAGPGRLAGYAGDGDDGGDDRPGRGVRPLRDAGLSSSSTSKARRSRSWKPPGRSSATTRSSWRSTRTTGSGES